MLSTLKKNIRAKQHRWNILKALKPKEYNFINWWNQQPHENWILQFCTHHNLPPIVFASVFGPKEAIKKPLTKDPHVFFSCENLDDRFTEYSDHLLTTYDLGIGFSHRNDSNYLRFPLWITYHVDPTSKDPGQDFVDKFRQPIQTNQPYFCTLLASHDEHGNGKGLRTKCYKDLTTIGEVLSAGRLLNNTDLLQREFNNDPNLFISNGRFNIAFENGSNPGYCTEKIFRGLTSSTIPIYWGCNGDPEPDVINQNAVIIYDRDNPQQAYHQVAELEQSTQKRKSFLRQEKVHARSRDYINNKLDSLLTKLKQLS